MHPVGERVETFLIVGLCLDGLFRLTGCSWMRGLTIQRVARSLFTHIKRFSCYVSECCACDRWVGFAVKEGVGVGAKKKF